MKKNNIYLFLIALALFIAAVVVFYESYFSKKKQVDKEESVNRGYGYYSQEVSLGCKTTTCSEEGVETLVQNCIINSRTGKYCINPDGEYSSKAVVRTQPCRIQCYSDQLAMYTGYETEVSKSVGIDNSITEYRTIKPGSGNINLTDENTGVNYTDYFLKSVGTPTEPKYSLKRNCIPDNIIPYQINTIHSQSNLTEGTKEFFTNCNNFNETNTLRFTGNLFNNYPEEDNINGTGKQKVCYDINNINRLEFLNSAEEISGNYKYPDECYKHSLYKNIDTNYKLWPENGSSNYFSLGTCHYTQDSEYFSITDQEDINNFSSVVEKIVNPNYTTQGDTNFYCKVMLNNETTLLDKIYSIGSCNLVTEKLDNNFFYVKGSPISEIPGLSSVPGYLANQPDSGGKGISLTAIPETTSGLCYYYPFYKSSSNLEEIHDHSKQDRKFYYFNIGTSPYIYFKNSSDRKAIGIFKTDTLYIDDNKFLGTPFKLLEDLPPGVDNRFIGIAPMNNIVLPVNNFPPNLTNYKSIQDVISFKNLYKSIDPGISTLEIFFTNNCYIYGENFTMDELSSSLNKEKENYQIKANDFREGTTFKDKNYYVYGNVSLNGGTFYYPVVGTCASSKSLGNSNILTLQEYPGINFVTENRKESKYTVPENFENAIEYFGIGSGVIERRFSNTVNYPSNLEINCRGISYFNLDINFTLFKNFTKNNNNLVSNIGVCRISLSETPTLNIKLLRSNNVIVTPDMETENYKEEKLKQYYTMINDQTPTSYNKKDDSYLTFLPQMSVSKVCDFGIFKSPYNIVNGTRNYICFDDKNNFLRNKEINVKELGEIINNKKVVEFENYLEPKNENYGCCYNSVGVRDEEKLVEPIQFREKNGLNIDEACEISDVINSNNYTTIDSYLEPCLQSRELERFDENKKDLDKFFTRDVIENKTYAKDEDIITNYEKKEYYLNSSENLKLRTNFFKNSVNLVKGELVTEVFDNYHSPNGDFNKDLGTNQIYNSTNYSKNLNKRITYEVTKSGFIPMSPSNIGVNFFYGKRLRPFSIVDLASPISDNKIKFEKIKEAYSTSLERNDNYIEQSNIITPSYGNWTERKFKNWPGTTSSKRSPYLILFGLAPETITDTFERRIFKSRFYDTTIGDPGNNIKIGDYIAPDFTYFNKFFGTIFNTKTPSSGESRDLINDLIITLDTPVTNYGTSILPVSSGLSRISSEDYFLFTSIPLGGLSGTCYYPNLEICKALSKTDTNLYVQRNVNNVNTQFLPNGYNDLIFVLGKNNSNVSNSIINNYYKITNIETSEQISDRYLEFNFQIPSMSPDTGSQLLFGTSTSSPSLREFINLISGSEEDFQTEEGSSVYNKLTPALSVKFIKDKITYPSSGNGHIFSNYNNSKINTKLSSYITEYKIEDSTTVYLNEFREDLNLLDKQKELNFEIGDRIKYYSRDNYSEEGDSQIQNFKRYNFISDLEVIGKNCGVSTGVSSFKIYDYMCRGVSGVFINNVFNFNSNLGISPLYEENDSKYYNIPYFKLDTSTNHLENLGGVSSFDFNIGLSVSFFESSTGISLGEQTFLDYYKLSNLPFDTLGFNSQNSPNFPYHSYFIRSGILDMVTLDTTTLYNKENNSNMITVNNITSDLKPYGNTYFISTPEDSSTRVNYEGYGVINSFNIEGGTVATPPGIYTSDKGIEIKITDSTTELAELKFKSIENYSDSIESEIPEDVESERLNWTNLNTPQFFKNISDTGVSFSRGDNTSWETVPYSFYPTQNFITGKVGNIYYKGDILLHDITRNLFQVTIDILKLPDNWWIGETTGLTSVTYDNLLGLNTYNKNTKAKENFYTFVEKNGLSDFLQNYSNIEMVQNLNNQNIPVLIKKFDNSLGDCPDNATYYSPNYETEIDNSFIKNTNFDNVKDIFKTKLSIAKKSDKFLSLGFTPVSKQNSKIDDLIFLQDNFDRNDKISQYIYSLDIEPLEYGKNHCIDKNPFTIGGVENNLDKFQFSNSILFNILPNSLDTQDHISYLGFNTFNGTSIIKFRENNFPVRENYFPGASGVFNSGVSRFILDNEGVSSSQGVSFSENFIKFNKEANSSSIKINQEYDLYSSFGSGISARMTIKELGYNLFSLDSMIGGSITSTTSNFTYGDYWYVHDDKNNISTFGYISPDETSNVNYNSFISLKEIKEPLDEKDTIKLITQNSGASVTNLNSFLNRNGELLNIKNYEIENSSGSSTGTTNKYYRAFTPGYTYFPFHIYLNFYDNGTGTSGILKYNEAIIHGYDKTITGTSQIYLPIEEDFYNYIKCRGIGYFGANSIGKIRYSPVEKERIIGSDGTSYTPLIFEPYQITTFLNNKTQKSTELATGKEIKNIENVQDCFIISLDSDNNINFKSNPFTDSIKNNFCNFVPSSLNGNRNYRNLGVIDSQSTETLSTEVLTGVSFQESGMSPVNISNINEIYTPGVCVPGLVNFYLDYQEIRQNLKTYFQERDNDCSVFYDSEYYNIPSNLGGQLNFKFKTNKFTIDPISVTNGIYSTGDNITIGKNLIYSVNSTDKKIFFSTKQDKLEYKSENFEIGTSALQVNFFTNSNYITEISQSEYLKSKNGVIRIVFRDNYEDLNNYKIYSGYLDTSDNNRFVQTNGVSVIQNTYS